MTTVMLTHTLTVPVWLLVLLVVALFGAVGLLVRRRLLPGKSTSARPVRLVYVPGSFVTTEDIQRAAGIARRTVLFWINVGLLPQPCRLPVGDEGSALFYPPWTLDRARFIAVQRAAGRTLDQIRKMIDDGPEPPPEGGPAAGMVASA